MKVVAINGSPRKGWNTHMLLEKALEGAKSAGAEVEMVNLYDLNSKGCIGCLGCKRKDGGSVGKCVLKDGLTPVLESLAECDAFILGSPIYIGEVTGELRKLIERLTFQYISYDKDRTPIFSKKIRTGFVFTTNCPEAMYETVGYTVKFDGYKNLFGGMFGECKTLTASQTWQIDDYDKYRMSAFDVEAVRKRREEVFFPQDCQNAFEIGKWLAGE
ncbi:MAG: flavodoxin family protein [Oscillospiraceae bacterium]|nr:flavodoxin family protein [Oscillospiraceae bacterium]